MKREKPKIKTKTISLLLLRILSTVQKINHFKEVNSEFYVKLITINKLTF